MTQLETKQQIRSLTATFVFVYLVSYLTRINYGAIISEMEQATGFSRSLLSMAPTGSFITYGVGQIVSGICGDRFSTKRLISLGLGITTVMNLLLPLCNNPYQMLAVWCVNGFAQAMLWPPIVKTMAVYLRQQDYGNAMVKVSWGSSLGTMAVYLLAPLLIGLMGWKSVFVAAAVCGAVTLIIWHKVGRDVPPTPRKTRVESKGTARVIFTPVMLCVLVAIAFHGMLRDSVMTWMPSYVAQTYQLDNSAAILSGVILPLFSLVCFRITERLQRNVFHNLLVCAAVLFGASMLAAGGLYLFPGAGAVVAVLLLAVIKGAMSGINFLLISLLPRKFHKYGNISTMSGVLNSATYVGSAVSTYGIAVISEQFGWSASTLVWLVLSAASIALCLANVPGWKKAYPDE